MKSDIFVISATNTRRTGYFRERRMSIMDQICKSSNSTDIQIKGEVSDNAAARNDKFFSNTPGFHNHATCVRTHCMRFVLAVSVLLSLSSCQSSGGGIREDVINDVPDITIPPAGDATGHGSLAGKSVYIFSQNPTGGAEDPQVYGFKNAVLIRGWQKWNREGIDKASYNFNYMKKVQDAGNIFIGGGTGSVLFREEAGKDFEDWATRDAQGNLVEHSYITAGAHKASIANPSYRNHIVSYCKIQIDGGIDGVFIDEANGCYQGGKKWNFNGNEGYDNYFLAGFNAYLTAKHPGFTESDWIRTYGMTPDNVIKSAEKPGDLNANFNYRRYLSARGWDKWPADPANPLTGVFGGITANRVNTDIDNFREKAMAYYWREMVANMREYAREMYHKEIFVTSNGIFPYVDFNSFGLYEYNSDNGGAEIKWMPVSNGRLNGAVSLKQYYRTVLARSRAVSGNVPLVLFIDWPTGYMDSYSAFTAEEKKNFWRIYASEAYANGIFFAFHLKKTLSQYNTAEKDGVLDFLKTFAKFFDDHGQFYTTFGDYATTVNTSVNCSYNVTTDGGRYCLHLVNHEYSNGIVPKSGFTVTVSLPIAPTSVVAYSPDNATPRTLAFSTSGGTITITVDKLEAYDCILIQ